MPWLGTIRLRSLILRALRPMGSNRQHTTHVGRGYQSTRSLGSEGRLPPAAFFVSKRIRVLLRHRLLLTLDVATNAVVGGGVSANRALCSFDRPQACSTCADTALGAIVERDMVAGGWRLD